jgi:pimeloyl-ACP methyl ester carboxylesterase
MKIISKLFSFTVALLFIFSASAKTVSLPVTNKIVATAHYEMGESNKPLLIFVHGFLQTNQFSTVKRLYDAFYENGFPVLAPNLSLGISSRAKSLACESIHLHSLDSDTNEIAQWVDWAIARGHKKIILIGHSAGSVNITAYLANHPNPAVIKTILISLTHYGAGRPEAFETEAQEKLAEKLLQNGEDKLTQFALSYCQNYLTLPSKFLSYYRWSDKKVLQALSVDTSDNYIIFGSADNRITPQWLNSVKGANGKVRIIDGANHFFDQAYEFDLLDMVENIVDKE